MKEKSIYNKKRKKQKAKYFNKFKVTERVHQLILGIYDLIIHIKKLMTNYKL